MASLGTFVVLGIVGVGGYVLLNEMEKREAATPQASKKSGWYVLLYNYPKGDPDRALDMFNGPFATQGLAEINARKELAANAFYPEVKWLHRPPFGGR